MVWARRDLRYPLATRLEYSAPIRVRNAGHRGYGVYWLRLLCSADSDAVAVISEVPANPGMSETNAAEIIATWVCKQHHLDPAGGRWFHHYPAGMLSSGGSVASGEVFQEVVFQSQDALSVPRWTDVTARRIDLVVGDRLTPLPSEGELMKLVLTSGGVLAEPAPGRQFKVMAASELPPPHNSARCAHHLRFEQMVR